MGELTVIDGDLLDVTEGVIAHQVNCQGVMGAGVARAIADRYPEVRSQYWELCHRHQENPRALLGVTQLCMVPTEDGGLFVANVFGQLNTGSGTQTDYQAVLTAVSSLVLMVGDLANGTLHVPYLMGCGLGGGHWPLYSLILRGVWPGPVIAHKLEA